MKRQALLCATVLLILMPQANAQRPFTLQQTMSAPFPANLTAAKQNNRIAWTLNQEGRRNIWVAEGPGFTARQITKYNEDDGQELSDVSFSADSNTIVHALRLAAAPRHRPDRLLRSRRIARRVCHLAGRILPFTPRIDNRVGVRRET